MRLVLGLVLVLLPGAAAAQGLVLGGDPASPPPQAQTCLSVTAGSAVSYSCLNARQKALVAQQKAGLAAAAPNQASPPPQLGLYNQAATREHLGTSFGHSVIPQAVPPPNYTSPLVPPR
jgi:hypothetical protein